MDNQLREVLVCPLQSPPPLAETAPEPPTSAAAMSAFQPVSAPAQPFLPAAQNDLRTHTHHQQWSAAAQQQPAIAPTQVASFPSNHHQQQQQQPGVNMVPPGALAFPTTGHTLPYPAKHSSASSLPLMSPQQAILAPSAPAANVLGSVPAPGVSPLATASSVPPSQLQYTAVQGTGEPQACYGASFGYPVLSVNRQQASSIPLSGSLAPSTHTPLNHSSLYHQHHLGASTSMGHTTVPQLVTMAHQATPVARGVALTHQPPVAYPMQPSVSPAQAGIASPVGVALTQLTPVNRTPGGAYLIQPSVSPAHASFASPVSPPSPASFSPVARAGQAQLPLNTFTPSNQGAMQLAGEGWMNSDDVLTHIMHTHKYEHIHTCVHTHMRTHTTHACMHAHTSTLVIKVPTA